ncbi:uncharacterized protein N7477_008331 [Penicillium maclennaniae]|uniref:uncharacterized protein n=1 Tax=Penicillium maclennaniae TaxID=1343394 RepID=UPI0025416918|nr:uncharacterized protein N7477_008331 [Penicillium maclennaniae]KAJ5665883.1 hypothetical protein N7477_008331 [Penicillium maclennaniae]
MADIDRELEQRKTQETMMVEVTETNKTGEKASFDTKISNRANHKAETLGFWCLKPNNDQHEF